MKRTFILGDEWIYYKLFCGKRVADTILIEVIKPLTEKLLKQKLIDKWFFIRYSDPKPHLRIRFHCYEIDNLSSIINEVKKELVYYIENDLIWNVQVDSYQREIERYGKNNMLLSEELFFIDSYSCINTLNLVDDDKLLFLFVSKSIDSLLHLFDFNLNDKRNFVTQNAQAFKHEFNADRDFNKQLSIKHKSLDQQFKIFMSLENDLTYQPLLDILYDKIHKIKSLIDNIKESIEEEVYLDGFIASHIHMMVNRFFRDQQRLYELVCYDYLSRFYNYKLALANE